MIGGLGENLAPWICQNCTAEQQRVTAGRTDRAIQSDPLPVYRSKGETHEVRVGVGRTAMGCGRFLLGTRLPCREAVWQKPVARTVLCKREEVRTAMVSRRVSNKRRNMFVWKRDVVRPFQGVLF